MAKAVLERNPELIALRADVEALEHGVPQAGAWPDPLFGVDYSNMPITSPWPGAHPMSGVQLRLEQRLLWPGKAGARAAVAEARTEVAELALAERGNALAGTAQQLYFQLALVRQLAKVTADHRALLDQLFEAGAAKFETGRSSLHELLGLDVRRDRLTEDLLDFAARERELVAELNALMQRAAGAPVGTPEVTELPPEEPPVAEVIRCAEQARPLVRRFEREARVEELAARRAEAERLPDVTASLGYRFRRATAGADEGEDFLGAGISLPLPWFWNERRWGELAEQHRAQRRAALARRDAAVNVMRGRIEAALARWDRARARAERFESGIVPAAERALEATVTDYRVGRAEFATLFQAEVELLDLARVIRTARNEAAQAAVEVATLAGAARCVPPATGGGR